jgi:hypothetical protein
MLIPSGTKIEVTTTNGGFARGKTYGKTEVIQCSDGLSVCGSVTIFTPGTRNASGVCIPAFRIETVSFEDFVPGPPPAGEPTPERCFGLRD